jgi:hypothetical protein
MHPLFQSLKSLGGFFGAVFGMVRAQITDDQVEQAVVLVLQAKSQFLNNEDRRRWVLQQLMQLGLPEHLARLALEMAMVVIKQELEKRQDESTK